jgi:predicted RecB family endonuclease
MIDERLIDKLVERLVDRIEQGNTYTLQKIGESIKKIGALSPSKAQQLGQILKYGGNYDKIVEKLAQITQLNVNDIYEIFEEVAKSDYRFAKQFYDYKGVKYIPYEQNVALQNQVKALARITASQYANFSNTLAFTKRVNGRVVYTDLARAYQETIDKAILSVAQGKSTFDEQMYSTIKELGESGLKTVDYANGRSVRLDSGVRQHLKGALRNLHNETQAVFGEEFGSDGVEISVHINPAPDHAQVQGRQFSKEEFEKFQNDQDAIDYTGKVFTSEHDGKDRRSISEYNCYHYTFDIVLGVSKPNYSQEELKQIIDDNNKGFELDGMHYTNYEGTQLQRKLETEIRKQKDIQIIAKASGNKELVQESQQKITQLTRKYKQLSDISGLPTKMERMRVSGYKRVAINKIK